MEILGWIFLALLILVVCAPCAAESSHKDKLQLIKKILTHETGASEEKISSACIIIDEELKK